MLGLQIGKFPGDAGNNSLTLLVSHPGGVPAAEFILQETFEGVARHVMGLKHTSAVSWDIHCPDVGILECLLNSLSAEDDHWRMIPWEPILGTLSGEVGH